MKYLELKILSANQFPYSHSTLDPFEYVIWIIKKEVWVFSVNVWYHILPKILLFQSHNLFIGSYWWCRKWGWNYAHRWCSQPLLNGGLHSGDVLISAAWFISLWKQFSKACHVCKVFKFANTIIVFLLENQKDLYTSKHWWNMGETSKWNFGWTPKERSDNLRYSTGVHLH